MKNITIYDIIGIMFIFLQFLFLFAMDFKYILAGFFCSWIGLLFIFRQQIKEFLKRNKII